MSTGDTSGDGTDDRAGRMSTLRLLTFNALFKGDVSARLAALGAILERAGHDVVCVQEVMYRRHAALLTRHFPHHRHDGGLLLKGGLVLLSRLPITEYRFVPYPRTGPARPEWLMRKGFQAARIGGVLVVNTHLSANRDGDHADSNRYTVAQRAELDHLAGWLHGTTGPLVVTGDLNIPRGKPALRDFLAGTGLHDVLAGDPRPTYRPTARWPSPPAFDHVLVRGLRGHADLTLQDPVTLPDGRSAFLSDHYGVAAELG
ncbi:endonuclease/exonuclease/phosphatase family metal-dependent hydrolase [Catenuloplanes nepalensis]|uniref:Endonuclease/exonuclease/phosphatase family metal-dependent hydrolase n=1 Tax=Catenuloplanes nepalensis TaxID=587533 RepID=A0ABT9MQP9_9ACTN|nr:endonuclease/exonuclease/phosphatase family protein [Catenuloplanes nepalensis]MDP9793752.1 endonuclease/exonuclease/phosphatase family metal-dependent hydrolase [Catenuloplanes nepalensis]